MQTQAGLCSVCKSRQAIKIILAVTRNLKGQCHEKNAFYQMYCCLKPKQLTGNWTYIFPTLRKKVIIVVNCPLIYVKHLY